MDDQRADAHGGGRRQEDADGHRLDRGANRVEAFLPGVQLLAIPAEEMNGVADTDDDEQRRQDVVQEGDLLQGSPCRRAPRGSSR